MNRLSTYRLFLLLAILVVSAPATAKQTYAQCSAAANSDMELAECQDDYLTRLEMELDQALEEVIDMLKSAAGFDEALDLVKRQGDPDILSYVYEEHEKWQKYAKTACLLFQARDNNDQGIRIFGSLGMHTLTQCRIFVTKQRIELLRRQACEFVDSCTEQPCPTIATEYEYISAAPIPCFGR